jgi:2-hydroxychromene-2-carboxylate isomerase
LQRFWQQEQDIDSIASIEDVLNHLGVTLDGFAEFADSAGLAAVEAAAGQVQELGVAVSPTYFIGTEPFQGRQHLPLLAARMKPQV